jgi:hypothetical protein
MPGPLTEEVNARATAVASAHTQDAVRHGCGALSIRIRCDYLQASDLHYSGPSVSFCRHRHGCSPSHTSSMICWSSSGELISSIFFSSHVKMELSVPPPQLIELE